MKLIAQSSAKLSDDVQKLIRSEGCVLEVKQICEKNAVDFSEIDGQQFDDERDYEIAGSFEDIIHVYNKLSAYISTLHCGPVDFIELRHYSSASVLNKEMTKDTIPQSSHMDIESTDEQHEEKKTQSFIPDPIILSVNWKEFSENTQESTEDDSKSTYDKNREIDINNKQSRQAAECIAEMVKDDLHMSAKEGNENDISLPVSVLPVVKRNTSKRRKNSIPSTCNTYSHLKVKTKSLKRSRKSLKKVSQEKILSEIEKVPNDVKKSIVTASDNRQEVNTRSVCSDKKGDSDEKYNTQIKVKKAKRSRMIGTQKKKLNRSKKQTARELETKTSQRKGSRNAEDENLTEGSENVKKYKSEMKCHVDGCNYIAGSKKDFLNHMQKYHDDKPLKCSRCDSQFAFKKDLLHHEKRHEGQQNFCLECGKFYKCHRAFLEHKKSHQEGYVKPEYVCEHCSKAFSTKYVLQYHIKSEHLGIKKSYLCPTCGKSFTQKNSYVMHANVHMGIRPYVCEICGDSFPYEKSLKEHKYMHDDIRRFKCSECGKSFRQPSALYTHIKIHNKSKEHLCGTCGKGFTQKQALLRHERIHSGDKPFSCNLCSRTFSDASIIRRHMIMVHKLSPSEWRTEVTSNISSKNSFFIEMLEGDKQPQLKKKGRPPVKNSGSSDTSSITKPEVCNDDQEGNVSSQQENVNDSRANAALTLSTLAVGGVSINTVLEPVPATSKPTELLISDPNSFVQKQQQIPCEILQPMSSQPFLTINNYTTLPSSSSVVHLSSSRQDANQPVMSVNYPSNTTSLSQIDVLDKNIIGQANELAFQEIDDPNTSRNESWSSNQFQYMYLQNYSQFQQIQ